MEHWLLLQNKTNVAVGFKRYFLSIKYIE